MCKDSRTHARRLHSRERPCNGSRVMLIPAGIGIGIASRCVDSPSRAMRPRRVVAGTVSGWLVASVRRTGVSKGDKVSRRLGNHYDSGWRRCGVSGCRIVLLIKMDTRDATRGSLELPGEKRTWIQLNLGRRYARLGSFHINSCRSRDPRRDVFRVRAPLKSDTFIWFRLAHVEIITRPEAPFAAAY